MPSIDVAAALHAARHGQGGPDPITPVAIGAVPATRWLTGTGAPEGVVAAPVGTVWTDTNATFGAVEWTKFTGTGSTGWRVTKGDTGTVNATSQCTFAGAAPITGDRVDIRRTVDYLVLTILVKDRASLPSPFVVTLPSWARPGKVRASAVSSAGNTPARLAFADGSASQIGLYTLVPSALHFVDGLLVDVASTATPWRTV